LESSVLYASIGAYVRKADAYLEPIVPLAGWTGAGTPEKVELNQSIVRIFIAATGGIALFGISLQIAVPRALVVVFCCFLIYSILHAAWVYCYPTPLRIRRVVTLLLDNLSTSFFAGYGSVFAIYAAIHFWTTVGYGLRFGTRYLFLASALATLGMAYNILYMPYWHENTSQGITIIVALIAMTASTALVFRRINQVSAQLAAQHAELALLARHDPLTGLPNRRYLLERLSETIARAERGAPSFALMLFDIDHFKNVNDQRGHEAGDELLQIVARRIEQRVRATDTFARLGGDEFVIILESVKDPGKVVAIAADILQIVHGIESVASYAVRVTASVGIAYWDGVPTAAQSVTALLQYADAAMYEAKRAGGNCFRFAASAALPPGSSGD
jgi:diguanylate cyclase (GGDEF)-like protein